LSRRYQEVRDEQNMLLVRTLVVALLLMTGLIGGCGGQEEQQAVTGEDVKEEAKEAVESTIAYTADDREAAGESYQGDGTDSASINRPQPHPATGACCLPNLSCTQSTSGDCEAAGGSYQGDGTDCASVQCDM
jgi:hypothetical protein